MTNKRRVTVFVAVATALAIAAGGLWASNMGFKLNYPLAGPGTNGSNSGRNSIGLPYNRQVGLDTASQLIADVGATANQLEKFDPAGDTNEPYPGPAGDFTLEAGASYILRVSGDSDYIIVGSHDPGLTINFAAAGAGSNSGRNAYSHPYHGVSSTASQLLAEVGGNQVERFNPVADSNEPYPGPAGDFTLVPGEGYLVRVAGPSSFVPAHY